MKKSMSFIAAIAMAATMVSAIPASATEITGSTTSGSTILKKNVEQSYTVTIPDSPESWEEATNLKIDVTNVVIAPTATLDVKVSSENYNDAWNIVNSGDAIEYTLKNGEDDVDPTEAILSVAANATGSVTLVATPPNMDSAKYAGDYTDTLTFTVDISTPSAPAQNTGE